MVRGVRGVVMNFEALGDLGDIGPDFTSDAGDIVIELSLDKDDENRDDDDNDDEDGDGELFLSKLLWWETNVHTAV